MTTKVTIDPANHKIGVQLAEGSAEDSTVTTETLNPGDPPRDFWLYDNRVLTVWEIQDS